MDKMGNKVQLTHVTGLRGIAILLVVWFHFTTKNGVMPGWLTLPNGYYGVDVFLTIMGYFLIMGFAKKPDLSLGQFVRGKFNRILPPLAILVLVTALLSLMVLNWQEYRAMCKTGCAAIFGVSNYELMYSSAGYFADNTAMNPLLHTWYLSVTLQVFACAYLVFLVMRRAKKSVCMCVLMLLAGLSLWYHLTGTASYYSTAPRVWEILAGGLVCLLPELKSRKLGFCLTCGGLLMILLPALGRFESAAYWNVVVVLGTVLCVKFGYTPPCNILSNRVLCFVGDVSFSLYLVHMPLLVLYKGIMFDDPGILAGCVLLMLSVIFAFAYYYAVEKRRIALWAGGLCCAVAVLVCAGGFFFDWRRSLPDAIEPRYTDWQACTHTKLLDGYDAKVLSQHTGWYILADGSGKAPLLDMPFVHLGDTEVEPSIVLLGDSHAQASYMGIDVICREEHLSGVYLASIIAPFWDREIPNQGGNYYYNRKKAEALLEWLSAHPELATVVIDQLWGRLHDMDMDWNLNRLPADFAKNAESLRVFCRRLQAIGKNVVILGPLPTYGTNRVAGFVRSLRSTEPHPSVLCTREKFMTDFGAIVGLMTAMEAEGLCKVVYPHTVLATKDGYPAIRDGIPLFKDADHLSVQGSLMVYASLSSELLRVLSPPVSQPVSK